MRRSQSNYLNMAKGTVRVFDNHAEVWKDEPLIVDGLETIRFLCGKIEQEAVLQQKNNTPGHTAVKDRQREMLEDRLFRTGGRVKVYTQKNDDRATASQVDFSQSVLAHMSLNTLLTTARTVVSLTEGLGAALEPYKVTDGDLDELRTAIDMTAQLNAQRDAVQGERIENTSHLETLFSQLRMEFKLMDTQVEAYIDSEQFLGAYFFTRWIHDVTGGNAAKKTDGE